jgi:hypothetical protein
MIMMVIVFNKDLVMENQRVWGESGQLPSDIARKKVDSTVLDGELIIFKNLGI